MPLPKYEPIYRAIKNNIENGTYKNGDFLPSENVYTQVFNCTRNTVRRALSLLTQEGYLIPQHGKGVQVIYHPISDRSLFFVGGIESLYEASKRNQIKIATKVITFETVTIDKELSIKTGFREGSEAYHIERLRKLGNETIIFDTNYFLTSEVPNLTKKIACESIYNYIENELKMTVTTSNRYVTAQKANKTDKKFLSLEGNNFVLVVEGHVFNSKGIMFEYTESRHAPQKVCFTQAAVRQKIW